jgi:4-hydroxy-3-polyprenylbenzoate decarboxylase
MTFDNYLELLKNNNELKEIRSLISSGLQISRINKKNIKKTNKALLFKNIELSKYSVITNLLSSKKRIDFALNNIPLKTISKEIYTRKKFDSIISSETLNSITENIDLTKLPAMKYHKKDGGKYFTLPCVITKCPLTGIQNSGIYRIQLFDKLTLGIHWHTFNQDTNHFETAKKLGLQYLETAIVLGTHPVNIIASALPFKYNFNELQLYEIVFGKKLPAINCKTVNLQVPKDSQIVIEGLVKINHYVKEGPFYMFNGRYDKKSLQPVFIPTGLFVKNENAIIPAIITGKYPSENSIMMSYIMKIFSYEILHEINEIEDIYFSPNDIFNKTIYIKIKNNISKELIMGKISKQRILKTFDKIIFYENL